MTVAPPTPEPIQSLILSVRRTLEVYALKHFFPTLSADDFDAWDGIVLKLEHFCRLRYLSSFPQLDLALHHSILERVGQPDLLAIWHTIA